MLERTRATPKPTLPARIAAVVALLVATQLVANFSGFCWEQGRWLSSVEKKEIALIDATRLYREQVKYGDTYAPPERFNAKISQEGAIFFGASLVDQIFSTTYRGQSTHLSVEPLPNGKTSYYMLGPCGCIRDWTQAPD